MSDKFVYQLVAEGEQPRTGDTVHGIRNREVFANYPGEPQVASFRKWCIEAEQLDGRFPINIDVRSLKVVE